MLNWLRCAAGIDKGLVPGYPAAQHRPVHAWYVPDDAGLLAGHSFHAEDGSMQAVPRARVRGLRCGSGLGNDSD